jgi:dTDP-3-amino-3,4,6-trideoxy-alpha-D-glucose transaminase
MPQLGRAALKGTAESFDYSMLAVPFTALSAQHAVLRTELSEAFDRVVRSSGFILGSEVEAFEREFAAYCRVDHCVGVASGTAALTLALRAAGIGLGDEVIVPAHTFIASALAVLHAGATPIFCDVSESDGLIEPSHARALISQRTAALMPVHLYGQVCEMDELIALGERHGLLIVEDAAQAHGARLNGRPAGSLGTVAAFSFYPGKNLGALGDGGAICTNDAEIAAAARLLRHLGQSSHSVHEVAGFNERLDGLQAAFLRAKLPTLDVGNERRRQRASQYRQLLPERVRCLPDRGEASVFHLFPVRVGNRDELRSGLAEVGIQTGIHYSPVLPEQPPLAPFATGPECPVASRWADEEVSLPIYPELAERAVARVVEEVDARAA